MDDNQLRDFYPGEYERQHGGNVRVMPTMLTSIERARERFFKKHRFDFISYTASRPTPDQALWSGFVLVKAKCESTGDCALFMVALAKLHGLGLSKLFFLGSIPS